MVVRLSFPNTLYSFAVVCAALLFAARLSPAQEFQLQYGSPPNPNASQYLFGDWGGERTKLHDRGIDFNFEATDDSMWILHGGVSNQEASWPRIRATVDIDFEKLTGAKGVTFHATGLWQAGVDIGTKLGSLADPSSLPSQHCLRLDSFWLQWSLLDDRVRLQGGQLAGYDFYGNSEYGASYLDLPLGYAFSNLNQTTYLSFNPAGTPALQIRLSPFKHTESKLAGLYVKSAILSGNRTPYQQDPTGFHFKLANSAVSASEIGYLVDAPQTANAVLPAARKLYPGEYKFGAILNNGSFENPLTGLPTYGNHLLYAMASQAVYRAQPGSNRGLDLTLGWDQSAQDVAQQNSQIMAGARYNGLLPHRAGDSLDFGFVTTKVGETFSELNRLEYGIPLGREKMYEVNYRVQVTPYLVFQPTVQYYASVGGAANRASGVLVGFRTYLRL